jgi:hypothetical protein
MHRCTVAMHGHTREKHRHHGQQITLHFGLSALISWQPCMWGEEFEQLWRMCETGAANML